MLPKASTRCLGRLRKTACRRRLQYPQWARRGLTPAPTPWPGARGFAKKAGTGRKAGSRKPACGRPPTRQRLLRRFASELLLVRVTASESPPRSRDPAGGAGPHSGSGRAGCALQGSVAGGERAAGGEASGGGELDETGAAQTGKTRRRSGGPRTALGVRNNKPYGHGHCHGHDWSLQAAVSQTECCLRGNHLRASKAQ